MLHDSGCESSVQCVRAIYSEQSLGMSEGTGPWNASSQGKQRGLYAISVSTSRSSLSWSLYPSTAPTAFYF